MAGKRRGLLSVVGKTEDEKVVVAGVYRTYETEGLPLDVILDSLRSRGAVPDWEAFVREAEDAGMGRDRILSMLDPAISDSYGPEFRDRVMSRLRA